MTETKTQTCNFGVFLVRFLSKVLFGRSVFSCEVM